MTNSAARRNVRYFRRQSYFGLIDVYDTYLRRVGYALNGSFYSLGNRSPAELIRFIGRASIGVGKSVVDRRSIVGGINAMKKVYK
jgi:hypothetical protein